MNSSTIALAVGTILWCIPLGSSTANAADAAAVAVPSSPVKISSTVADIIRMMDAGVSKEVIHVYIENSPARATTPDDLIALKQHAAPDNLTTALIKRTSEAKTQSIQTREKPAGPPPIFRNPSRLDPEGYDFWYYHYACPRALSAGGLYPYSPYQPYWAPPFIPRAGLP